MSSSSAPPIGCSIAELDTPALCIDLDVMEANIARMAAMCREHGVGWRPHTKAMKTPELARRLIAAGCGISDPLDQRVVEAYWVGNDLLDRVALGQLGDSMAERFRKQVGNKFQFLAEGVLAGGVPHHSFHVFGVYPWVGLLGNDRMTKHALTVLDRCRVRWGKVIAAHGDQTTVESRPLGWDGRLLSLGEPATETARLALDGTMLAGDIGPGDWVALHWDWVCDKLTDRQLRALRTYTMRHLDMVNHRVDHPGPVAILG